MTNNTIQQVFNKLTAAELLIGNKHPAFAKISGATAMLKDMQQVDVEAGARAMHEAYEAAARVHGWATNERCKTDFDSLPDANRLTMLDAVAACAAAWGLTTKQG